MSDAAHLIGIAGPSGAGKSFLARHLSERLKAPVLALDRYYRDLSHLSLKERALSNFDDPTALERDLLIEQVSHLREGRAVEVPVYDFTMHTRRDVAQVFRPARFVIVEGLYALHWPELRDLLTTRVYVDASDSVCLRRRLERDMRERGRTRESVMEQFRVTVAPMAERYVRPGMTYADVVIAGTADVQAEVNRVLAHVRQGIGTSAGPVNSFFAPLAAPPDGESE